MTTVNIIKELRIRQQVEGDRVSGEAANRLEFLERALEQAVTWSGDEMLDPVTQPLNAKCYPDLAAWLQEHNASTVPVGDGA